MRKIVEETCEVICEDNGRKMVGDIIAFKESQYLTVAIDKKLKLELKWNSIESNKMITNINEYKHLTHR
jgi:hypothetical protein